MTRHYSTQSFFREVPNDLLDRYFQGRGLLGDLDFAGLGEIESEKLFAAWLELSEARRSVQNGESILSFPGRI